MNRKRDLLRVSCKCAIFTPDGRRVLLADYGREGYGLPGGHIDSGESPDDAVRRELAEELGLENILCRRADFFLHPNGKIVLGFVATLDDSVALTIQPEEIEGAVWCEVSDIQEGIVPVPSYKEFILKNVVSSVVV